MTKELCKDCNGSRIVRIDNCFRGSDCCGVSIVACQCSRPKHPKFIRRKRIKDKVELAIDYMKGQR